MAETTTRDLISRLVAALRSPDRWMQLTDAQVTRAADLLERQQQHPVTLPKDPPERFACWLQVDNPSDDAALFHRALVLEVWSAARREVERQQEAPLPTSGEVE